MTDADLDDVEYYDDGGVRISAASVTLPSETIPLAAISGVTIERRRLTVVFVSLYVVLSSMAVVVKRLFALDRTPLFGPLALVLLVPRRSEHDWSYAARRAEHSCGTG